MVRKKLKKVELTIPQHHKWNGTETAIQYRDGTHLVPLEGIPVALGGFLILLIGSLKQTVHMPAFIEVEETFENLDMMYM